MEEGVDVGVFAGFPFEVDVCGRFPPGRVEVCYEATPRPSTEALDALIAEEWSRQLSLAAGTERQLFNGELFRYVGHSIEGDGAGGERFRLRVGPTCYRDFVGTNLFNNRRLGEFGWHRFANPVGTTATLITSDGLICYGRRSERVAYHAGHVHTLGGAFEKQDQSEDGSIDPFGSVCRELTEELGLERGELAGLCCVGLIRDKEIHQPEMLFEATLSMNAHDLRRRWAGADHHDEHVDIVTLRDRPEAIAPFLKGCGLIAPVAVGALILHGFQKWGKAWVEGIRKAGWD